jgi:hypothetical protein
MDAAGLVALPLGLGFAVLEVDFHRQPQRQQAEDSDPPALVEPSGYGVWKTHD